MSVLRPDLGFTAYGNVVTAVAGVGDPAGEIIAVTQIHQVAMLPVCTRCGAAVPIPYQERHAEWHDFIESKIGHEDDPGDLDWTGPIDLPEVSD